MRSGGAGTEGVFRIWRRPASDDPGTTRRPRLAEAGCEVPEIATITGHSLKNVEAILDAHYLGRTTKLAASAVAKLEPAATATGTDGEQQLENNQTVPDAARDK
jgi:hypothetical protein